MNYCRFDAINCEKAESNLAISCEREKKKERETKNTVKPNKDVVTFSQTLQF